MNRLDVVFPISFKTFQESLVSRPPVCNSNLSKEELVIKRLEEKLGISGNEVKKLVTDDLISLLAQVPTSENTDL